MNVLSLEELKDRGAIYIKEYVKFSQNEFKEK